MAQFGFGMDLGRMYKAGRGLYNEATGNTYQAYASSGQLEKDIDAAMQGFVQGDGRGMAKLQANLSRYGKNMNEVIAPHLAMQKQKMDREKEQQALSEQQRRGGVYNEIMAETQPRAAVEETRQLPPADLQQFGIGSAMSDMMGARDEDEGDPNVETVYRPGSAGRALTPNDMFRMAGPDMDPSKMAPIMRVPGQMAADEARAENLIADTSVKKTQASILADPAAHAKKLTELGLDGGGGETGRDIGYTVNPTGGVTVRNNPQRRAADAGNRIFNDVMEATQGDVEAATKARENYERRIGTARSGGSQQGMLEVKETPRYLQNQTNIELAKETAKPIPPGAQEDIDKMETFSDALKVAKRHYRPEYLGPLKGTDAAFSARRRVGGMVGAKLEPGETTFRQASLNMRDLLARERSGAAIGEREEYDRIIGMLPKPTDEPHVFEEAMRNVEAEYNNKIARRRSLATQPRGAQGGKQPAQGGKPITMQQAQQFLQQAGGDKNKARQLATQAGFDLNNVQ